MVVAGEGSADFLRTTCGPEGEPAIRVYQGKGGKDRIVPMMPDYFRGITAYLEATGRTVTSPGRVFLADDRARQSRGKGAGITSTGLYLMLRSVLVEGGIDTRRRGVHALRHQYAIEVLRESKNLVVVQKLLGHANIATTSRYVDHLELGELRDALPRGPAPARLNRTVGHVLLADRP